MGVGRLAFSTGDAAVRVGPFKFGYSYPDCIDMYPSGSERAEHGFHFTAISARDLRDINVHDPKLRWFSHKVNRREDFVVH